jgi:hypothetical protein
MHRGKGGTEITEAGAPCNGMKLGATLLFEWENRRLHLTTHDYSQFHPFSTQNPAIKNRLILIILFGFDYYVLPSLIFAILGFRFGEVPFYSS